MSKTVSVNVWLRKEDLDEVHDMADALRKIADLIDQGYTSGHYPNWELVSEEEKE